MDLDFRYSPGRDTWLQMWGVCVSPEIPDMRLHYDLPMNIFVTGLSDVDTTRPVH
jgi:hypothetical protein